MIIEEITQFILDAGSDDLNMFGGKYQGGVHSQQVPDELAQCIFAILQSGKKIESYFELGVAAGGTTFIFNHFFHPGKIVLLDNNEHPKCGLRADVLKGIKYIEIINVSQADEAIKKAGELGPYDLIFIDGIHQNPWARGDVLSYSPFLASGGFLALHDSAWKQGDVGEIVQELKDNGHMEFVDEYVVTFNRPILCGIALFRKAE